jgi:hypothetical protein
MLDHGSVRDEDHIGRSGLPVDQADVGDALQVAVQLLPLGECLIA